METDKVLKKKRVYVSGAVSTIGHPGMFTPSGLNAAMERFGNAAASLTEMGYDVCTPFDTGVPSDAPYERHLAECVKMLSGCDAIYMLKDWRASHGAKIEHFFAVCTGKEVLYEVSPSGDDVKSALEGVFGMGFDEIAREGRERTRCYARMIFCKIMRDRGFTSGDIARQINRDRTLVISTCKKYDAEYRYNTSFKNLADRVFGLLGMKGQ